MPKQDTAARFEAALIDTVNKLRLTDSEPALKPFAMLLVLLDCAAAVDDETAGHAEQILADLSRVYDRARANDDNWPEWLAFRTDDGRPIDLRTNAAPPPRPRWKSKRVLALKQNHLPPDLAHRHALAACLWPILPLVNFLHYTRKSSWTPEEKLARIYEYAFIALCTKPKIMWPLLYELSRDVVTRMRRKFPGLDQDKIDNIASAVAESFERRESPVCRYKARARSIPAAAKGVRQYMQGAIRRRAQDVIRVHLDPSFTVPASTLRRWRRKHHISVESPDHAEEIRKQMAARQTHSPPDRISLAEAARRLKRARSTTTNALPIAEKKHGFTSELGPDGTILLTHEQVRWLRECLPAPRPRRRKLPSR